MFPSAMRNIGMKALLRASIFRIKEKLIRESPELIRRNYDDCESSGQTERLSGPWRRLSVRLLDGAVIDTVLKAFELKQ